MAATADTTLKSVLRSLGRDDSSNADNGEVKLAVSTIDTSKDTVLKQRDFSRSDLNKPKKVDYDHVWSASIHSIASDTVEKNHHNDPILLAPYNYLTSHPGKSIRSKMIQAFDHYLQVPQPYLTAITRVVEMLHNASLLIDDIEDDSTLRRGAPVAHHIYGTAQTINSANYAYFMAQNELQEINDPTLLSIFTEELLNLHRGQGIELFWRDSITCPTEEEFIDMINNKTGGLLRLAVRLMMATAKTPKDCTRLVNLIGIHFQIRDDYMNLQSKDYTDNKGFCEDLSEGKFSFPVIHSIRSDPKNRQLMDILKQKPQSVELKKYALKLMEATDTFAYTRHFLHNMHAEICQEIALLGHNPLLEKILAMLNTQD
ncbi:unnamed protein product [Umbelopsis sp. WA50703]